jgi:hypothetical protein
MVDKYLESNAVALFPVLRSHLSAYMKSLFTSSDIQEALDSLGSYTKPLKADSDEEDPAFFLQGELSFFLRKYSDHKSQFLIAYSRIAKGRDLFEIFGREFLSNPDPESVSNRQVSPEYVNGVTLGFNIDDRGKSGLLAVIYNFECSLNRKISGEAFQQLKGRVGHYLDLATIVFPARVMPVFNVVPLFYQALSTSWLMSFEMEDVYGPDGIVWETQLKVVYPDDAEIMEIANRLYLFDVTNPDYADFRLFGYTDVPSFNFGALYIGSGGASLVYPGEKGCLYWDPGSSSWVGDVEANGLLVEKSPMDGKEAYEYFQGLTDQAIRNLYPDTAVSGEDGQVLSSDVCVRSLSWVGRDVTFHARSRYRISQIKIYNAGNPAVKPFIFGVAHSRLPYLLPNFPLMELQISIAFSG